MQIEYSTQIPSRESFSILFETTGWHAGYQAGAVELMQPMAAGLHCVCACDGQRLVGFGRVLTEGVLHAMICDMIVLPECQGQGIGREILGRSVAWYQERMLREIQLFCAC